jgi:hypothetical protein
VSDLKKKSPAGGKGMLGLTKSPSTVTPGAAGDEVKAYADELKRELDDAKRALKEVGPGFWMTFALQQRPAQYSFSPKEWDGTVR